MARTTRELQLPSGDLTKGPNTMWDAPGMQRIKIPFGGLNATQLEILAELAEEYSDNIAHITTRQDVQLHYVHMEDTPTLMRRLASVGITTREACGNSVRNVTGCPIAGVCQRRDCSTSRRMRRRPHISCSAIPIRRTSGANSRSLSRAAPTNPALSRVSTNRCIAAIREENGEVKRGFEVYVGGGLGPVPYQAKLFTEFLPKRNCFLLRRRSAACLRVSARRRTAIAPA